MRRIVYTLLLCTIISNLIAQKVLENGVLIWPIIQQLKLPKVIIMYMP